MNQFTLHTMQPDEWREVASLIHDSTNGWYQANRNCDIFPEGPESTLLFCQVYEALDPGCCLVAKNVPSGKIIGSCFFHPRETHYSLGIMNVLPEAFGCGVARGLLQRVIQMAGKDGKPVRLVSSAMNLDSYSLYTKAGFVPRQLYQDMILDVPANGLVQLNSGSGEIRDATVDDIHAMAELEQNVAGIRREKDYRYFIENENGIWHTSVFYQSDELAGWIVSIANPASKMIGPCIARNQQTAITLLENELHYRAGNNMVFLVPVDCELIVKAAYGWGARNCELHLSQVLGEYQPSRGVVMPTFMPETG